MAHKFRSTKIRAWFTPAALVVATIAFAQETPTNTSNPQKPDETVVLSPFVVKTSQVGRYQSSEATSGGRVAINVFDASSSISVIPQDLLEDISSSRILDAAKYVSGVTESILPGGLDRTTIRGFQQDGTTVDGFNSLNQQGNIDPILIERMEVVKGPNAILAPANGNAPGGTINLVTRKPQFKDFGSVSYQVGRYDGNHATLDVNRRLDDSWAFRIVAATFDTKVYPDVPVRNTTVMPMITWRSKTGAQLTAQFEYFHFHDQNYLGLPIDPSIGATGASAKVWGILPQDLNLSDNDYRDDLRKEARILLVAPLGDAFNMRLAMRYADVNVSFAQNIPGQALGSQSGGAINPLTGLYTPGFVYGAGPTFTPSPANSPALVLGRNGADNYSHGPGFNLQNDYVYDFKNKIVKASTVAGVALNYFKQSNLTINADRPSINYAAPATGLPYVDRDPATASNAVATRNVSTTTSEQLYVSQTLKFLEDKIALNGSLSYNNFDLDVRNKLTVAPTASVPVPQQTFNGNIDTQLKSYGVVLKPIPSVVVYYGYSENTAVNGPGTAAIANGTATLKPLQEGTQKEYGVRWQSEGSRFYVTLCHFDIAQTAFSVPNPANLAVPQPVPLLPALISDRSAKGWELEVRANLTKQLSLIGNATTFRNRDPNGVPFRGTAEKSGALLVSYQFDKESSLHGLTVGVGADYLGRRPGDGASGLTAASTPSNVIPNQPTYWLAPRTLVNLMVGYKINDHWNTQLNADNLLNNDYIAASVNRPNIIPGQPINVRLRLTYKF